MGLCASRKDNPQTTTRVRPASRGHLEQGSSGRRGWDETRIESWDEQHVVDWLMDNKLNDLVPIFSNNNITGEVIPMLDKEQIKKLEIQKIGDVLLFERKRKELVLLQDSLGGSSGQPTVVALSNRNSVGSNSGTSGTRGAHTTQSLTPSSYHHNTNQSGSFTQSSHPSHPSSASMGTDVVAEIGTPNNTEAHYQAVDPRQLEQVYYQQQQAPPNKPRERPKRNGPNTSFADPTTREPSVGSMSIYSTSRTYQKRAPKQERHARHASSTSVQSNQSGQKVYANAKNKIRHGAEQSVSHTNSGAYNIAEGQPVEVLSQTLNQWVKGKVVRFEVGGKVLVHYLDRNRVFDLDSDHLRLRPLSSGADGSQAARTYQHRSGQIPVEEEETFDLAYQFWKLKAQIATETSSNGTNPTFTFSGAALKDFLRDGGLSHMFHGDPIELAQKFLEYGYIRPTKSNQNRARHGQEPGFSDSSSSHYSFHPDKQLLFHQMDLPDRVAWTLHTEVQVYSNSRERWLEGVITEIKPLLVYVQYGPPEAQYGKVVQRYSKSVRSKESFMKTRLDWTEGSVVQVLSKSTNQWCQGVITKVAHSDSNNRFFMVKYTSYVDSSEKTLTKWMERWSPDLKDARFNDAEIVEKWGL